MRIGITGANGLIGSELSKQAKAAKHEVIPFSRNPSGAARKLDPSPTAEHPADFSNLDALVHLAGEPMLGLWTKAKKTRIRESRVDLSRRIVNALGQCENPPKILIGISGTGYYGDRGDEVLDETATKGEGFVADLASDWEQEIAKFDSLSPSSRTCHARMGVVFCKDGGALLSMARPFRLGLGGRLGSGKQWVPWVHLYDAAAALLEMVENENLQGAINVAATGDATNQTLTKELARAVRRPALFPVPAFILRLALRDMSELLLSSQRAAPQELLAHDFSFRHPELPGALHASLAE